MSFEIEPGLTVMFDTFKTIEMNGVSYMWGALLTVIICAIVSNKWEHIKVTMLPTASLLHLLGIFQHPLTLILSAIMFISTTLSVKMVTDTLKVVATGVQTVATTTGELFSTAKAYGETRSIKDAITFQRNKKRDRELEYDNILAESQSKDSVLSRLLPNLKKDQQFKVEQAKEVSKPFSENIDKLTNVAKLKRDTARETGKEMALNRKHQNKMQKLKQRLQNTINKVMKERDDVKKKGYIDSFINWTRRDMIKDPKNRSDYQYLIDIAKKQVSNK